MRQDIALGRREAVPFERFRMVLRDTSAAFVADGEIVLRREEYLLLRHTPMPFAASA